MTNVPGGQGSAPKPQPHSESPDEPDQQPASTAPGATPATTESSEVLEPINENFEPSDKSVGARRRRTKDSFRHRSLAIISGLIVFFTVATLGTALLATAYLIDDERNAITTLASDIAKTAIPTLIALLGTAAAWAFKEDSEKD